MGNDKRKATFNLPEELLQALDQVVANGAARNKNAFVQQALTKELSEWQRRYRRRRWEEAMHDPLFLKDIQEVGEAFASADADIREER